MDKKWKAGDTCTIRPSRKHSVLRAKCARMWTVYDVSGNDALVHDGPAGMTDLSGPGWTCSARVPLDCLLPAGDARPTVAAETGAEVLRLRARIATLEDALRWRVTAEEMPPVGEWVTGEWDGPAFEAEPYDSVRHDGMGWATSVGCVSITPARWQPIHKPGADVPKGE